MEEISFGGECLESYSGDEVMKKYMVRGINYIWVVSCSKVK